ncbi:YopX family protein [Enterococcus lactis]|uniref:YopX family protein n=1 Tax=Enterococcus lactis TaxID=357441 RepID=UPI0035A67202
MIPKFRLYDPLDQKIREVAEIDWPLGIVGTCGGAIEHELDKVVLMQSTGLKNCEDINGAKCESWEGDIVEVGWSDETGEYHSHIIVLKNPFEYTADEVRWLVNCYYITILGNIYENPELLGDEQR